MLNNTIDKTVGILQVLTDKLSGITDKAKECTLLSSEYEDLNNKLNALSAMFSSDTNESDIVSVLNLPRAISEYTNDHIGEIINIPYNDEAGIITSLIEFEVVGVNHHKDINDESKPTITLMTKNIIRHAAFDAAEPTNPDGCRAGEGDNRWSVSNIRQWLNSDGAANSWFTAQHDYDEAPTTDKVDNRDGDYDCAYADEPGFLAGFSDEIKSHFATVANTTWVLDTSTTQITNDKVFLASLTEMGYGNNNGIAEGTHLSIKYPDKDSRIKGGAKGWYWLRSACSEESSFVWHAYDDGYKSYDSACAGYNGLAPLVVLM